MKRRLLSCSAAILLLAVAVPLLADQKIKKRMSFGQQAFDTTTYLKGERSRDEMNLGQMQMITIHQCDAGQDITVNDRAKAYMIKKTGSKGMASGSSGAGGMNLGNMDFDPPVPPGGRKGGTVTIKTSVQDTGEKKDFFGYTARHLKAEMDMDSSPDACDPNKHTKIATDGWFIAFKEKVGSCEIPAAGGPESPMARGRSEGGCVDHIKISGAGMIGFGMSNQGYPVDVTTTFVDEHGKQTSMRQQALEISTATLDPSLFEPPAGYREAKSYADLMGFGGMGAMMAGMGRSAASSRAPSMTPETRASSATPEARGGRRRFVGTREIGPKQPGKLRVGVVAFEDKSGKMTDADELRQALMESIEHFGYETVPIDSRTQSAAMNDAKDFECDYVVFNTMTPKASAGQTAKKIGGFMGRRLGGLTGSAADRASSGANNFEGTVDFQLFKVAAADTPSLTGTQEAQGDNGGKAAMDKESKDVAKQIMKGK